MSRPGTRYPRHAHTAPNPGDDWRTRAACADEDPELFFTPTRSKGRPDSRERKRTEALVAQAKAICAGCPVRQECLHHAMTLPLDHGIAGGLTEDERDELRRKGWAAP